MFLYFIFSFSPSAAFLHFRYFSLFLQSIDIYNILKRPRNERALQTAIYSGWNEFLRLLERTGNQLHTLRALTFRRQHAELPKRNLVDADRLATDGSQMPSHRTQRMEDGLVISSPLNLKVRGTADTPPDIRKTSELTLSHRRISGDRLLTLFRVVVAREASIVQLTEHMNHIDSPRSHVAELPTALDAC